MTGIVYPTYPDFKNIFKTTEKNNIGRDEVYYCLPDGRKFIHLGELKLILVQEYQDEIIFLYLYEKMIKEVMKKFSFTQEDAENAIHYNLKRYGSSTSVSSLPIFPSTFSPVIG